MRRGALRATPAWIAALLLAAAAHAQPAEESAEAAAEASGDASAEQAGAEASGEAAKPTDKPGPKAIPLPELWKALQADLAAERQAAEARLQAFRDAKVEQQRALEQAQATVVREEGISAGLERRYGDNEQLLERNQKRLEERLGQLGELFGVVRQVATDTSGNVWASLTSAELGQRKELLDKLGRSKELPSTHDLERLWFELQREMTAQGEVTRFRAPVLTADSEIEELEVTRAGPFAAVAHGGYLKWEPSEGKLRELTRQPPSRYVGTIGSYLENEAGFAPLAVDPSRGILMEALTDTPSLLERVQQGGSVGYVIIGLGLAALALGLMRWIAVSNTSRKVNAQQRSSSPRPDNPLGRVLAFYNENRELDPEHLELKLEDVILKENARVTRLMWLVRTVSVVAPLLGLLGTVTGMIQTFQAITLFGTGDPKMMAGGISEALVTTMLGLITAIPLVLLYETLSSNTRRIMNVLDENVANLIAVRTESENNRA